MSTNSDFSSTGTLTEEQKKKLDEKITVVDINPLLGFFSLIEFVKECFAHHQACPLKKGDVDKCVICRNLKMLRGKHR